MSETEESDQWKEWLEEFQRESDRACAVLGPAFLDEQLRGLLQSFFVDDAREIKKLFEQANGSLATLSAKIDVAYALGFLALSEVRDLHLIRKIRNEFAHQLHGISFTSPKVKAWCRELKHCNFILEDVELHTDRDRFVISIVFLAQWIALRKLGIRTDRRKVQSEVGGHKKVRLEASKL